MNWYKKSQKAHEDVKDGVRHNSEFPKHESQSMPQEEFDEVTQSKWQDIESSFISGVSYFEPLRLLEIKMKSGKEYIFSDVPKSIFKKFMESSSKGKFFNEIIKKKYKSK